MKKRLLAVMKALKGRYGTAASMSVLSRQLSPSGSDKYINNMVHSHGTRITREFLDALCKIHPDVNRRYIEDNEGEPLFPKRSLAPANHYTEGMPLVSLESLSNPSQYQPVQRVGYNIPHYSDCDFYFINAGDDMVAENGFMPNAIVPAKKIEDGIVIPGKPYIVITESNTMLREIRLSEDPEKYVLVAWNKRYQSFEIEKIAVTYLYLAVSPGISPRIAP